MNAVESLKEIQAVTMVLQRLNRHFLFAWGGLGNAQFVPMMRGMLGNIGIGRQVEDGVSTIERIIPRGKVAKADALWDAWHSLYEEMRRRELDDATVMRGTILLMLGLGLLYWCYFRLCGPDFPREIPSTVPFTSTYRWAQTLEGEWYRIPSPVTDEVGPVDEPVKLLERLGWSASKDKPLHESVDDVRKAMEELTQEVTTHREIVQPGPENAENTQRVS
ncbi:MAG TPA: hypothetical protein VFE47_25540 [Tepidisphaeraceae bacterium]|jgi:hypothetical protein|nr:hypothetical protein [Tepidisphaeraceae bacterium]